MPTKIKEDSGITFVFKEVNIDRIGQGDTVFHNGSVMTVGKKNIKICSFMGLSLFGDTYKLGRKPVLKAVGLR